MATLPITQPFHIGIPEQVLDDLRCAAAAHAPRAGARKRGWEGGSDPDYLDELIALLARRVRLAPA